MRSEAITCDVCRAVKQQTNHWYVVGKTGDGCIYILTHGDVRAVGSDGAVVFDLCGESCVHKKISELIAPAATA
jgi:hypothetical protein